jgi:hypothetical protein
VEQPRSIAMTERLLRWLGCSLVRCGISAPVGNEGLEPPTFSV